MGIVLRKIEYLMGVVCKSGRGRVNHPICNEVHFLDLIFEGCLFQTEISQWSREWKRECVYRRGPNSDQLLGGTGPNSVSKSAMVQAMHQEACRNIAIDMLAVLTYSKPKTTSRTGCSILHV